MREDRGAISPKFRNKYFNNPEFRRNLRKKNRKQGRGPTLFLLLLLVVLLLGGGFIAYLASTLHSLERLENPKPQLATEIYSSDGVLLTKFFLKNRTQIQYEDISKNMIHALVSTEDDGFYDHWGFHLGRFLRAMVENIVKLRERWHGASTITQQLAKNLFLTPERSIVRKLRELLASILIERTYTKEEILSLYLNTVYFGQGAYGIEAAAWTYFAKPARELTISESATLVAVLKSPLYYDPVSREKDALKRRNLVLNLMHRNGLLEEAKRDSLQKEPVLLRFTPVTDRGIAPYFTEHVRQYLQRDMVKHGLNIYEDGLIVHTTIDTRLQEIAERAMKKQIKFLQDEFDRTWSWHEENSELRDYFIKKTDYFTERLDSGLNKRALLKQIVSNKSLVDSLLYEKTQVQASFVVIEPQTGYIKTWIGGRDFDKYRFDRVVSAKRQPGSTFKSLVYLTALDQGIPPNYPLLNQPVAIETEQKMWIPKNSDEDDMGGETTLRNALKRSLNHVTIRLALNHAQPSKIEKMARKAGIETSLTPDLAMALGASVVTPIEMASVYATFSNGGVHVKPVSILSIRDKFENELVAYDKKEEQRIDPDVNYVMISMLQDVVNSGTGVAIRSRYGFQQATIGKTGTTQGQADAWFVGSTPQLSACVWAGFDDNRIKFTSMSYGQGSRAALPIWAEFMKGAYEDSTVGMRPLFFKRPKNVHKIFISHETNAPAYPGTEPGYYEYFTDKMIENDETLVKYLEAQILKDKQDIPSIQNIPSLNAIDSPKQEGDF